MKGILLMAAVAGLALTGCNSNRTQVDYKEAQGYFVRNDAPAGNRAEKIETLEDFDRFFGAAATMSALPTSIDFTKEFVAAVMLAETDRAQSIRVDSLVWNGSKLDLYYSILTGAKQSYTIRPVSVLIIDRAYDGKLDITVNETTDTHIADMHNARNSLDYTGTYKGTIPCADCSGIEVLITLKDDGTYSKTMTYIGKEPDNVFTTSGSYHWAAGDTNVVLKGEKEPDIYKVEENRIIMLDGDGNLITGDLANLYILEKQQ